MINLLKSDEESLEYLIENNPSLIRQIDQYFTKGPEVVLLPRLEWDFAERPNFNEEGDIQHYLQFIKFLILF